MNKDIIRQIQVRLCLHILEVKQLSANLEWTSKKMKKVKHLIELIRVSKEPSFSPIGVLNNDEYLRRNIEDAVTDLITGKNEHRRFSSPNGRTYLDCNGNMTEDTSSPIYFTAASRRNENARGYIIERGIDYDD